MTATTSHLLLHVNNDVFSVDVPNDELLVHTLRDRLGLRSVRPTCGFGICGTCTVLLDGQVASSCLMLTVQVGERPLLTSEGLTDPDGRLSPVQQAFVDRGAYQCSYCIPGIVLTVEWRLAEHPGSSVEELRDYLTGNLCRCGTYVSIVEALTQIVKGGGLNDSGPIS